MEYEVDRDEYKYDQAAFTGTVGVFVVCALLGEGSFIGIKKRKPTLASCKTGPLFLSELDNCLYGKKLVLTHFCGQVVLDFNYVILWQYRANEEVFPTNCPCCNLERYITRLAYPGDDLPLYPVVTKAMVYIMDSEPEEPPNEEESSEANALLKVNKMLPMGENQSMYCIANNALNDKGEVLFIPVDGKARKDALTCATNYLFSN